MKRIRQLILWLCMGAVLCCAAPWAAAEAVEPSPLPDPEGPFSLVWLPDTQSLTVFTPEDILSLRDWIRNHRAKDNILGVIHTGDLVDNGFKQWQWDNFYPLLDAFDADLFFFPIAGNHDVGQKAPNFTAYLQQSFLDAYPEEQKFEGGKMLYRVLHAGDTDLLLLGIGWEAYRSAAALAWINDVLAAHPDMPCILIIHRFLLSGTGYFGLVEEFIAQRPAIRLVLCGHMRQYSNRVFTYDDDGDGTAERTVNALMLNMQVGEVFTFRLLTFDPATHDMTVTSYWPDGSLAPDKEGYGPISFVLENVY